MKTVAAPVRQVTILDFMKCNKGCEDALYWCWVKDRHWPYWGTVGTPGFELARLHIMIGEGSLAFKQQDSVIPDIDHDRIPKGYRLFHSNRYGSEDWGRYWKSNGRLYGWLSPGDVVHETYRVQGEWESRYYLVIEDARTRLLLLPIKQVPRDPRKLLRDILIA